MSSDNILMQQRVVLNHIQESIKELGYDTKILDQSSEKSELKVPILLVGLPRDNKGRDRIINLTFMLQKEQFDYLSLIQCYSPSPFQLPSTKNLDNLEKLILAINNNIAVGNIGLTNTFNIFYRYVMSFPKWALIDKETLQQLFIVFISIQDNFFPLIEKFIMEKTTVEEILSLFSN